MDHSINQVTETYRFTGWMIVTWSICMGAQVYRCCDGRQIEVCTGIKAAEKLLREGCVSCPQTYLEKSAERYQSSWALESLLEDGLGTSPAMQSPIQRQSEWVTP